MEESHLELPSDPEIHGISRLILDKYRYFVGLFWTTPYCSQP